MIPLLHTWIVVTAVLAAAFVLVAVVQRTVRGLHALWLRRPTRATATVLVVLAPARLVSRTKTSAAA